MLVQLWCGGALECNRLGWNAVWNAAPGVLNLSAFRPVVNAHECTYEAGSCYHGNYVNIGVARGRVTKGQTKDKRQRRKEGGGMAETRNLWQQEQLEINNNF